ncbi:MAG: DUF72 domain-containing protein [Bacteroidetes bacterium]|jgi:uncharacterized protein YecE (DUF72 family)|nr:DUF72 domain-containing protein [Bacteroidota bacterium]
MMSIKKYHIGLTQWGLKEWKGEFYTDDASQDQFLKQYASVFNSVEGNTTFYRVPSADTVLKWGRQVPDGFKFCFKFPQTITHYKRLKDVETEVMEFLERFEPIRTKVGPFHIQLSSQFSFREFEKLEALCDMLPPHYHYAVEVRHPDFYDRGKKENRLFDLLKAQSIDRVTFDTRKLHSIKGGDETIRAAQKKKPNPPVRFDASSSRPFVRFVGANDILNNETYLKEWAIITADWIKDGLHPYIFIHAPDTFHAPELARYFHNRLAEFVELESMPQSPKKRQNEQLGLF